MIIIIRGLVLSVALFGVITAQAIMRDAIDSRKDNTLMQGLFSVVAISIISGVFMAWAIWGVW